MTTQTTSSLTDSGDCARVGSVHLGWHYFVDGLVGIIMLAVIWYAAGRAFGLYGGVQVIRATT